ncbi:MAG: xylulokinase [Oscillospiraceae bacterium]|nr:xylulokinase [Oscillospiraceae bacterium]
MAYLLGIDLGTSGTKTVLYDETGKPLASHTVEYPLYQPRNGWAEQHPLDWWNAVCETTAAVISKSVIDPTEIAGVGISGQMHGLVMLDGGGNVLRPSIIWCDQRTGAECDEMTEIIGAEKLMDITANPALTGFTASKILWVRNNEPEIYDKCRHILLPKDYIRFMLTGEFATDVSDASGMQLLDVRNRCWSDEVIGLLKIDRSMLAKVYESPDITGKISASAAKVTGLAEGTLVVGGAGDNAAAAVGTGTVRDGKAFTTIGSSGVIFAHTSNPIIDKKGRIHTFCCAVPGAWHVMGVTQGAGLSLKWFRDTLCHAEIETSIHMGVDPYQLLDKAAERLPIGAENLLYLPYLMGERTPHCDPNARGVFFGLSPLHTKAHMLRALMEGVSYSLRDCLEVIMEVKLAPREMLVCGGGGRSPLWRQMLADVYGLPVSTITSGEGPALGVAILAGVAAKIFKTVEEGCDAIISTSSPQNPNSEDTAEYMRYYKFYTSLYPALKDNFKALAGL